MTESFPKVKVALLGCGQIADAHLSQISRIPAAEVVAVCDVYEDLAYQAALRFHVPRTYTSMERMLAETQPDVVHITTPAHTHADLAIQLLHHGCHVYVEKPFTLDGAESARVLAAAELADRKICVGHDQLFDPMWLRCREWIQRGAIGEVRHLESILGYPISGSFGELVSSDPNHWVRKLPGGLFQNTISHPLYRLTDLLADEQPEIFGNWFTLPEFDFPTELQLSLQGRKQSASLTFSTRLPPQRVTRVYGSKGTLEIDFDIQTVRVLPLPQLPGAFAKLEVPWKHLRNAGWNLSNNIWRFARGDIHYFAGMKELFARFYASIQSGGDAPIAAEEIHRVTLLMDRIFAHCSQQASAACNPSTKMTSEKEVVLCE